jgi:hypothetical protein
MSCATASEVSPADSLRKGGIGVAPIPARIGEASLADWDRLHRACAWSTFYHSPAWVATLARAKHPRHDHRPLRVGAWHFRFADGLEGVVPFTCYRALRGLARTYHSGCDLLYGGWIGNAYPESGHDETIRRFLRRFHLTVRNNPISAHELRFDGRIICPDRSVVLDLSPGYDAIEARWRAQTPKLLQYSRKALRSGVVISRADRADQWKEFARIHALLRDRIEDATVYSGDFLETLRASGDPRVQLWIATHHDRIVAGQIALPHGSHVALFIKGATPEALALKAPRLIDTTMIEYYAKAGFRWYDTDGLGGRELPVGDYKRQLGCVLMPSSVVARTTGITALLGRFGRSRR